MRAAPRQSWFDRLTTNRVGCAVSRNPLPSPPPSSGEGAGCEIPAFAGITEELRKNPPEEGALPLFRSLWGMGRWG